MVVGALSRVPERESANLAPLCALRTLAHQKIQIMSADDELLRRNEWKRSIGLPGPDQFAVLRHTTRVRENCYMEVTERDRAMEVVLESRNDTLARKWPMPGQET